MFYDLLVYVWIFTNNTYHINVLIISQILWTIIQTQSLKRTRSMIFPQLVCLEYMFVYDDVAYNIIWYDFEYAGIITINIKGYETRSFIVVRLQGYLPCLTPLPESPTREFEYTNHQSSFQLAEKPHNDNLPFFRW